MTTWFKCPNNHIIFSKATKHKMVFCKKCGKMINKKNCTKYHRNAKGYLLNKMEKIAPGRTADKAQLSLILFIAT